MTDEPVYKELIVFVARLIETAGLFAMVAGITIASTDYLIKAVKKRTLNDDYEVFRTNIGRSILLRD